MTRKGGGGNEGGSEVGRGLVLCSARLPRRSAAMTEGGAAGMTGDGAGMVRGASVLGYA